MPSKPNIPCKHPGCPKLVSPDQRYCEDHKINRQENPERRQKTAERGYSSTWRIARKRFLEANPLCVECKKYGKFVKATDVDHIIPHKGNPKLFWDETNWQPLCHRHHSIKTRKENKGIVYHY